MDFNTCVCGSKEFIFDSKRAEVVCKKCGMVFSENSLNFNMENRETYSNSTNVGQSTTITHKNTPKSRKLRRIQQNYFLNSRERTLAIALNIINRNSSILNLPKNIKDETIRLYRQALENDLIRGRSIEGVVAACLYSSCKLCSFPRSLDEISEVTGINRRSISRINSVIIKELDIKLIPSTPDKFIPRFVSQLGLSNKVETKAKEIIFEATKKGLISGKDPVSIAAASLYMASVICNVKKSQKEISEVTNISDVTIRARYKELAKQLDLEINV